MVIHSPHLLRCLFSSVWLCRSVPAAHFHFYLTCCLLSQVFTSDLPRRSRLEMSTVSPVAAVSTPPVPLFCSLRFSRIFLKRGSCIIGVTHIFQRWEPQYGIERVCVYVQCVLKYPAEVGQANMHTSPEPSAEVRGAGEDVAQALIPHELPASLLN